jgi:cell division protease FtsH
MKKATELARKMVTDYGMSEKLGPQVYGHREEMPFLGKEYTEHRNYSEEVAKLIDAEVASIISEGKKKTDQIIKTHKKIIEKIADDLLAKETINEDEFKQYFVEPKKQK